MNKNITLNKKDGTTEEMTQEAFSRWACLVEGIQAVDQKLVDAKVPDSDTKWVKPLAFEKYIQERYHSMLRDVEVEHELGNI
jgi:iron-sulfur cluster repair protein YtfE (RIC family)